MVVQAPATTIARRRPTPVLHFVSQAGSHLAEHGYAVAEQIMRTSATPRQNDQAPS